MAWKLKAPVLQLDVLSSYFTSVTLLCDSVPMSGILMQVYKELVIIVDRNVIGSQQSHTGAKKSSSFLAT